MRRPEPPVRVACAVVLACVLLTGVLAAPAGAQHRDLLGAARELVQSVSGGLRDLIRDMRESSELFYILADLEARRREAVAAAARSIESGSQDDVAAAQAAADKVRDLAGQVPDRAPRHRWSEKWSPYLARLSDEQAELASELARLAADPEMDRGEADGLIETINQLTDKILGLDSLHIDRKLSNADEAAARTTNESRRQFNEGLAGLDDAAARALRAGTPDEAEAARRVANYHRHAVRWAAKRINAWHSAATEEERARASAGAEDAERVYRLAEAGVSLARAREAAGRAASATSPEEAAAAWAEVDEYAGEALRQAGPVRHDPAAGDVQHDLASRIVREAGGLRRAALDPQQAPAPDPPTGDEAVSATDPAETAAAGPEAPGTKQGEQEQSEATALLDAAGTDTAGDEAAGKQPVQREPQLEKLLPSGAWVLQPSPATAATDAVAAPEAPVEGAAMQAAPPVGAAGAGECGQGPVLAMCEGHGVGVEQEILTLPAPDEGISEGIPVQRPLPEMLVTDRPDPELGADIFVQPSDPGGGCSRTDCGGWPGALLGSGLGVCAGVPGIGSC